MNADQPDASKVLELFNARVPQIASGTVTIRGAVRDPGNRTVLAVASNEPSTDAVGACVGNRGAIVKDIVKELHGERIDVVLWSDSPKRFISNLFGPVHLSSITLDEATHEAIAVLSRDSDMPAPEQSEAQIPTAQGPHGLGVAPRDGRLSLQPHAGHFTASQARNGPVNAATGTVSWSMG